MKFHSFTVGLIAVFFAVRTVSADPAEHVNPFIGTALGSGNTYPGAQVPFGMISWSPQSVDYGWSPGGYNYAESRINGFGLVHLSGVGCSATCEFPFIPCIGDLVKSPASVKDAYCSSFSHTNEMAVPGYYSVKLSTWDIGFETTVKTRSGIAHIDFPATAKANLVLNPNTDGDGVYDGLISIDPTNQMISGWVRSGSFCGIKGCDYTVYFAARFDRPFAAFGTWQKDLKTEGGTTASGPGLASYVTFDCRQAQRVSMKVGISYVSVSNALLNVDGEIPGWNFSAVRRAARHDWNDRLSRIQITGGNPPDTTIFYTALYHALMLPAVFEDVNGEYRGMDNQVHAVAPGHHFLATFSGWDTYRTQAQLWGLLYPDAAEDFCTSLLNMSQQTQNQGGGGFPLWSMFNDETLVMAGYPADPYIANAYAFGATNLDLMALKKVMVDSGKNQRWCGRNLNVTWDHQPEYEQCGYVPADVTDHACSKTVEFSVADFAIAQVCRQTGDTNDYEYFHNRSQAVFNLINPATGYLQRKKRDGTWIMPFDRFSGDGFMEGNSAQYTWTIPHSLNRLFTAVGGREKAEAGLDELTGHLAGGYDYQSKYYEAGNEPCFGVMPVYNWLGKPWKTQDKIRTVMASCFLDQPAGIPGDDDSGAMSAWFIFNSLGMYPEIPGVGGLTIMSPMFPRAVLHLPNGRKVTITAKNAAPDARYVQSMTVNGRPNSRLWLTVGQLQSGASIGYVMGTSPDMGWGTGPDDAPPSFESESATAK